MVDLCITGSVYWSGAVTYYYVTGMFNFIKNIRAERKQLKEWNKMLDETEVVKIE